MLIKNKAAIIAFVAFIVTCSVGLMWVLKIPRAGGVADFNVYFERCDIPSYEELKWSTASTSQDEYRRRRGALRIGDEMNKVRVDMLLLILSMDNQDSSPIYEDMACVLHEIGLSDNGEFVSDIRHFGDPLGNLMDESDEFKKTYPGPKGASINAWMEKPEMNNFWFIMDESLGIKSNDSDPGTRELVLEIKP